MQSRPTSGSGTTKPTPTQLNGNSTGAKARLSTPLSPLGRAGASMMSGSAVSPKAQPPASPSQTHRDRLSSEGVSDIVDSGTSESAVSGRTSRGGSDHLNTQLRPASQSQQQSAAQSDGPAMGDQDVMKFHSALRWDKPWEEIVKAVGSVDLAAASTAKDAKTGNVALHIASQNGHLALVERLLTLGVSVNSQNGKGQTPLHMSVEYDFYFVSKALLGANADANIVNKDGHKAIEGIDGNKVGVQSFDNPLTILKAARTKEQLDEAFVKLEEAQDSGGDLVDKAELIQIGMQKKKMGQESWDHKRFMVLAAKF